MSNENKNENSAVAIILIRNRLIIRISDFQSFLFVFHHLFGYYCFFFSAEEASILIKPLNERINGKGIHITRAFALIATSSQVYIMYLYLYICIYGVWSTLSGLANKNIQIHPSDALLPSQDHWSKLIQMYSTEHTQKPLMILNM